MSTLDSGSACSRYNIYGQWFFYLGSIMDSYYGLFTTSSLALYTTMEYRCLLLGDEAIYYAKWMISLDVITMMSISINGTFTCCIQVMSTTQFLHPMSPSSMCVYTKDNASLQSTYLITLVLLVTLFSSYDTHVSCHVMFYIMTCHCII